MEGIDAKEAVRAIREFWERTQKAESKPKPVSFVDGMGQDSRMAAALLEECEG